jgi:hypothetical protein
MESKMRNYTVFGLAAAAVLTLAACADTPPTVVVANASPAQAIVVPGPPPQAVVEFKPPPPPGSTATVWQPGHWRWVGTNGATWEWVSGQYVTPPAGYNYWVPGQWELANGSWSWIEGHWAA